MYETINNRIISRSNFTTRFRVFFQCGGGKVAV